MNNSRIKKKGMFWTGIGIFLFLILIYFIKIPVDSGINFITLDSLLGIIIFHNPFVLGLYILIVIVFVVKGFRK